MTGYKCTVKVYFSLKHNVNIVRVVKELARVAVSKGDFTLTYYDTKANFFHFCRQSLLEKR